MKKLSLLILMTFLFCTNSEASFISELKEDLRPSLIKVFGAEFTIKILGQEPGRIELPDIPEIKKNAKSIEGLSFKPKVTLNFKKEQLERYNYIFIKEIVKAVREVEPSGEEISRWMNVLSQEGSREGVYSAVVLDNTYMGLQNMNKLASQKTLGFTLDFLSRFVNKSVSKENLAKVNFYVLKREVAERTLQVVDELFRQEGDGIYDWYAVFSSEIAMKFPDAMDNDVRRVTKAKSHKAWAKSVTDAFMKSEVLIKLHSVFNFLQAQPE